MSYRIYYTKGSEVRIGHVVSVDNLAAVRDVAEAFEAAEFISSYSVFGLTGMRLNPSDLQLKTSYSKWSKKP